MPCDHDVSRTLLEVEDLKVHFPVTSGLLRRTTGRIKAVDGISFRVRSGETLGIVGESGSGKTTAGRAILRLTGITAGKVRMDGTDITAADKRTLKRMRPLMQMIFQDPQSSLNPRMTIADIIGEPLDEHRRPTRRERALRIGELMDAVGLNRDYADRFPHEFSGGQRQRIGIARALALNPRLIVCDEPIASLDFSIQAQVVNLLADLQVEFALTYLFISHDLGMIRHMADRVAVMYLGKIVELAPTNALYRSPRHPYTQALLSAAPEISGAASRDRVVLRGEAPSPQHPPGGCVFQSRCPVAADICKTRAPRLEEIAANHRVACHLCAPDPVADSDRPSARTVPDRPRQEKTA